MIRLYAATSSEVLKIGELPSRRNWPSRDSMKSASFSTSEIDSRATWFDASERACDCLDV